MEAKAEPIPLPDHQMSALILEMVRVLEKLDAALNHMLTHVEASQDEEIERLREPAEELEKSLAEKSSS